MIRTRHGDIFASKAKIIAHGCNNHGVMGAGIARTVREKYPETYADYQKYCAEAGGPIDALLGTTHIFSENGRTIFNMITQGFDDLDGTGRHVSYDSIAKCFEEANRMVHCRDHGLAIPMVGAGLGGGKWPVIFQIIKSVTPDITVTVYKL